MLYHMSVNYADNTTTMHSKEDSLSAWFWKNNVFSSSGVVEDLVCAGLQDIEIKENVPSPQRAHSLAPWIIVVTEKLSDSLCSLVKVGD